MEWLKRLSPSAGQRPWSDDFPLADDLPDVLGLDLSDLREPVHPMLAVRMAVFRDWHEHRGRKVEITAPKDSSTRVVIEDYGIESAGNARNDIVLPVVRINEFDAVEAGAGGVREKLEYELTDVAPTRRPRVHGRVRAG